MENKRILERRKNKMEATNERLEFLIVINRMWQLFATIADCDKDKKQIMEYCELKDKAAGMLAEKAK